MKGPSAKDVDDRRPLSPCAKVETQLPSGFRKDHFASCMGEIPLAAG